MLLLVDPPEVLLPEELLLEALLLEVEVALAMMLYPLMGIPYTVMVSDVSVVEVVEMVTPPPDTDKTVTKSSVSPDVMIETHCEGNVGLLNCG